MKIKAVSERTGLTQKTIRFYESVGLIEPKAENINGRAFRDYSEADIAQLKEIAVLRRARFSIEEILYMQEEPQALQEIFSDYYHRMKQEKAEMEQLVSVLDSISTHSLTSKEALVDEITAATEELSLPAMDVRPHFKYLDLLEEKLDRKDAKKQKKKADLKRTAAMTQGGSLVQLQTKSGVRDGSMPGASVLMTMRMLDDSKDDR